ncbi:MAG: MATE family efflux transporter [Clostridia bacterium]|nr:MATE family efflux transporter [Clostridia bacterium]
MTINDETKKIFKLALPLILQQLFTQLLIWADTAMLGHVNSQFFSALANVFVPFDVVSSILYAMCTGTTILVAQKIGAKDFDSARKYSEVSYIGNSFFSVIAFLIMFFGARNIFQFMGIQSPILEFSVSYVKILAFVVLAIGINGTSTSILQGIGITKIIMIGGIVSNLLNILLDYLLIFGIGPFPTMGIEGAALATTISNYASIPITLIYVFRSSKIPYKMRLVNIIKFKPGIYKNVLIFGLPSGGEYLLWNIGCFVLLIFMNHLSQDAAGIYNLVLSIEFLPIMIYTGFANAGLTLVGQKTGEENHKAAIRIGFKCLKYAFIVCGIVAIFFVTIPKPILSCFTDDEAFVIMSVPYLRFLALIVCPRALNNVLGPGIRALGDTNWMLYTQIFGTIFTCTLAYVLVFHTSLDVMGIFITFFADELVRGIINTLRFWKGREFFGLRPYVNKDN